MNVVVVRGVLSRSPEERTLPSGSRVVAYEVTVARAGERAESVPVAWADPPKGALALVAGDEVVVVGRVRRRFFRAGGVTQSGTEVAADVVVKASSRKRVAGVLATARDAVGGAVLDPEPVG